MIQKVKELQKEVADAGGPKFEAKTIVADFSNMRTMEEYRKVIVDKVKDLDVGVVVLNAGHAYNGTYELLSVEEIESQICCLELQYIYLAKAFAEILQKRFEKTKAKGAMIFISSMASLIVCPALIPYVSAKHFTSGISQALSRELRGQVDCIDYIPSYVKTNIIKGMGIPDTVTISAERASQICLRDLGWDDSTCSSLRHWFFHAISLMKQDDSGRFDLIKQINKGYYKRVEEGNYLGYHKYAKKKETPAEAMAAAAKASAAAINKKEGQTIHTL